MTVSEESSSPELTAYRCPDCLGELQEDRGFLQCKKCSIRYPMDDLCVDLLDDRSPSVDSGLLEAFFEAVSPIYESLYFPLLYRIGTLPDSHSSDEGARKIVTRLPKDIDTSLDIAAGTGRLTRLLAERSDSVHALDLSRKMLSRARQSLEPTKDDRVNFCRANALHLPFGTDYFDTITCSGAIYFFPNLHNFLKEVSRVIAPDGFFAGMTVVKQGVLNNVATHGLLRIFQAIETYNVHEISTFKDELNYVGFTDFHYECSGCVMIFSSRKSTG